MWGRDKNVMTPFFNKSKVKTIRYCAILVRYNGSCLIITQYFNDFRNSWASF